MTALAWGAGRLLRWEPSDGEARSEMGVECLARGSVAGCRHTVTSVANGQGSTSGQGSFWIATVTFRPTIIEWTRCRPGGCWIVQGRDKTLRLS